MGTLHKHTFSQVSSLFIKPLLHGLQNSSETALKQKYVHPQDKILIRKLRKWFCSACGPDK